MEMSIWRWEDERWQVADDEFRRSVEHAVLACPGPSLREAAPHIHSVCGRVVIGMNRAYPTVTPDIWVTMAPPRCFESFAQVWDQPFPKLLRGGFPEAEINGVKVRTLSGVYFMDIVDSIGPSAMFDNLAGGVAFHWNKSTILAALHLALWMGAKRVYFVGADFGGPRDYCDDTCLSGKDRLRMKQCLAMQLEHLRILARQTDAHGLEFVSCTPDSPLNDMMPYVALEDAL